ncbi:MAG: hypothetical protein R6T85_06310 [Egibacteraceae bacterium]
MGSEAAEAQNTGRGVEHCQCNRDHVAVARYPLDLLTDVVADLNAQKAALGCTCEVYAELWDIGGTLVVRTTHDEDCAGVGGGAA